jgi:hypothetical protein
MTAMVMRATTACDDGLAALKKAAEEDAVPGPLTKGEVVAASDELSAEDIHGGRKNSVDGSDGGPDGNSDGDGGPGGPDAGPGAVKGPSSGRPDMNGGLLPCWGTKDAIFS